MPDAPTTSVYATTMGSYIATTSESGFQSELKSESDFDYGGVPPPTKSPL